jgi:hypothetical protein
MSGLGVAFALWPSPKVPSDQASKREAPESAALEPSAPEAEPRAQPAPLPVPSAVAEAPPSVPLEEGELMARLRTIKGSDPELAVALATEGNRRFPDSADAPERTSILIHALAALGRASEARGAAEEMVNHYADSAWVAEVEAFTGAHRHRNLRVAADGKLESY